MRNFYRTLRISPFSDHETIRRVVKTSRVSPEIEAILLDANRRRIYDRAWNCLSVIAQLRANLDLNGSAHWKRNHSDFSVDSDGYLPLMTQLINSARQDQEKGEKPSESAKKDSSRTRKGCFIWFIFLAFIIWIVSVNTPKTSYVSPTVQSLAESALQSNVIPPTIKEDKPVSNSQIKPKKRPKTGRLTSKGNNVAPFSIVTQYGRDYYIKLEKTDTPKTVMTAYIRGGDILDIKVPIGNYVLKYASGTQWYGQKYYFGDETVFSKADEIFFFKRTPSGYEGYTVELVLQRNGNLHTSEISWNSF